ncbi:hypothetical protein K9N68_39865 (plasmid) [Kovacikia minuta CCNUW1]|uniref:hypothetical protein n=1 Tax=Kovacikia minuta TaxID=2931930 RepID=UPI001CCD6FE9|nr:hypothetical protein [Kovacikia minuta]UBF30755.1 hypothetical protein K9N68_39865 [Kovacikia minuta CCNUW1]
MGWGAVPAGNLGAASWLLAGGRFIRRLKAIGECGCIVGNNCLGVTFNAEDKENPIAL